MESTKFGSLFTRYCRYVPSRMIASRVAAGCAISFLVCLATSCSGAGVRLGMAQPSQGYVDENVTLGLNEYVAYPFSLRTGGNYAELLDYRIDVTRGGDIDLYIVPPDGRSGYENHTASFRTFVLREQNQSFSGWSPELNGPVSVIVDNTDLRGAIPTGSVNVSVFVRVISYHGDPVWVFFPWGWLFLGMLAVVVIAVAVLLALRSSNKI